MINRKNFTGLNVEDIPLDTEYQSCNFSRRTCIDNNGDKKGVRLFPGDDTPRTFINCNMVNCEPPPDSVIEKCNLAVIERNILISSDVVQIDKTSIAVNEYVNRCYGKFTTNGYLYFVIPKDSSVRVSEVEE